MTPSSSSSSCPSRLMAVVSVWLCLTVTVVRSAAPTCPSGGPMEWLADPDDCAKFYVCYAGRLFDFNCDQNVWDTQAKTCVKKGSPGDKCTIAKELDVLTDELNGKVDTCENSNSAVFAKDDHCGQYYDCSSQEVTVNEDPHVVECAFPQLFNADTKRCEHHSMVKCGDRPEPKDACDYVANQCSRSAHCVPCNVRFPSCKDQPDGLNPWLGREYSPYYVLCQDQRALYHGTCDNSHGTQLFDPDKRICELMTKEE